MRKSGENETWEVVLFILFSDGNFRMSKNIVSKIRKRTLRKLEIMYKLAGIDHDLTSASLLAKQKSINDAIRNISDHPKCSIGVGIVNISSIILVQNPGNLSEDRKIALAVAVMVIAIVDVQSRNLARNNHRVLRHLNDALRCADEKGDSNEFSIVSQIAETAAEFHNDEFTTSNLLTIYHKVSEWIPKELYRIAEQYSNHIEEIMSDA